MSTTGLELDLSGIDPNLLMGSNNQTANAVSSSGGSLMNNDAGVGPDEVVPAEGETIDANSTLKTTGLDTTLLSTVSGETTDNTPQIAGLVVVLNRLPYSERHPLRGWSNRGLA